MTRFFVDPAAIGGGGVRIGGEDAAHARVLRLRVGEQICVCDGRGTEYICRLTNCGREYLEAEILSAARSEAEPDVFCRVLAAYPKGDKAEHIVQKSVELGAGEIAFFPSVRCVSRPAGSALENRRRRWQKIAEQAAGQCGRGRIPEVHTLSDFGAALALAGQATLPLLFYELEREHSVCKAMAGEKPASVALMTGPEGGFEAEEVSAAQAAGLQVCTLGKRILRCETAPLCALTAVMLLTGNL